jgi:hypothetical protein
MTCWDIAAYSFFDSYDVELLGKTRKRSDLYTIGESPVVPIKLATRRTSQKPISFQERSYLWRNIKQSFMGECIEDML